MPISRHRIFLAVLASAVLLSILVVAAHVRLPDLSRAQPIWLVAVLAAHFLMVTVRGLAFRALAPAAKRTSVLKWFHLAARHQLVFSVVPGGVGDTGFPYFAKRIAGLNAHDSVRTIAQFRARDLIFLALMGFGGLILLGLPNNYALIATALVFPLLWFSDDITVGILRVGTKLAPTGRLTNFLQEAADHERPTASDRLLRTMLALIIWTASVIAVIAAFRAVGVRIDIAEALVFIAAVNFAGAISLSIAGLGPSEAGATVALVAAGNSIQRASSLALVVRPLLLVSVVCASVILDVGLSIALSGSGVRRVSTR